MKPERKNIFLIGEQYAIFGRKVYALTLLDDDGIAEAMNGGEVLPIVSSGGTKYNKDGTPI